MSDFLPTNLGDPFGLGSNSGLSNITGVPVGATTPPPGQGSPTVIPDVPTTTPITQTPDDEITRLTNLVNQLNQQAQTAANQARIPGAAGLEQQSSNMIGQELSGQLPQDVQNQLAQYAAERGISTGNSNLLQQLGLNSLQAQQQGQQNLTAAYARNPAAPIYDPSQLILTPAQQAQLQNQQSQTALNWWQALNPNYGRLVNGSGSGGGSGGGGGTTYSGGGTPTSTGDPFSSNLAASATPTNTTTSDWFSKLLSQLANSNPISGNTIGAGPVSQGTVGNGLTTSYVPGSGTLVNYNLPNDWFTPTSTYVPGSGTLVDYNLPNDWFTSSGTGGGYLDTGYNSATNQSTYDPFSGYLDSVGTGGGGGSYSDTSYNSYTDQSTYDPFSGYLDYTGG